jgi:hypothetical protein
MDKMNLIHVKMVILQDENMELDKELLGLENMLQDLKNS